MNSYDSDTITALATPYAKSALSVIRISGSETLRILDSISSKKISENAEGYKAYYTDIVDNDKAIDEVVVVLMLSPKSFTGEDAAEIMAHGSLVVIEKILSLIIEKGARHARAGEFSYRAYINGKINLSEAEAIHDLVESENMLEASQSLSKLKGAFREEIVSLREKLRDALTLVEGELDFPEDETEEFSGDLLKERLLGIVESANEIVDKGEIAGRLMHGVNVVIAGHVNAGKSSLFNALLGDEKAIVTDIPGTTRDILNEVIYINNMPFRLNDTAGLQSDVDYKTIDAVEKIGIKRSLSFIAEADLVLLVLDQSLPLSLEDKEFIARLLEKKVLFVLNKSDLDANINLEELRVLIGDNPYLSVSAVMKEGLSALKEEIYKAVFTKENDVFDSYVYVNKREVHALREGIASLTEALRVIDMGETLDVVAYELRVAKEAFSLVLGEIKSEEVLNTIFASFCIGK